MTMLVVGIFGHRSDASLAIEAVQETGIKSKQISAVTKQKTTLQIVSQDTGIGKTEAGEGNGGLFGTARSLGVGLEMLPDTAVAAGPAARKLAGGDLDIDGLKVSLMSLGIPGDDAEQYAKHADMEHIIVIVEIEEEKQRGKISAVFEQHQAIPLGSA